MEPSSPIAAYRDLIENNENNNNEKKGINEKKESMNGGGEGASPACEHSRNHVAV